MLGPVRSRQQQGVVAISTMRPSCNCLFLLTILETWSLCSGTSHLQWLPYALEELDGYLLTSLPNYSLNQFTARTSGAWGVIFSDLPLLLVDDNLARDFADANGLNVISKSAGILQTGRLQVSFVSRTYSCINLNETDLLLSHNSTYPMLYSTDVFQDPRPGVPAITYWLPDAGTFAPTSALASCVLAGPSGGSNSSIARVVSSKEARHGTGVPLWDSHAQRVSNGTLLQDVDFAKDLLLKPKQFWRDLSRPSVIIKTAVVESIHLKRRNTSLRLGPQWNLSQSLQVSETMFHASLEQASGLSDISAQELGATATSPPPPPVATNTEITLSCLAAFAALAIIDVLDVRRSSTAAHAAVIGAIVIIGSMNVLPLVFLLVQDIAAANYVGTAISGGATISAIWTTSAPPHPPEVYAIGVDLTMARVGVTDARVELIAILTAVAVVAVAVQFVWAARKVVRCVRCGGKVRNSGAPKGEQLDVEEVRL